MTAHDAIRVLLVDDHPVVREGLRSMLQGEGVEVVAEAGSGAEAVDRARDAAPDVVLLDMQLPDMEGVAALRQIQRLAAPPAVLVLSMHDDPALVRKAMDAGAAGYLLKGVTRHDLLAALRSVRAGTPVVDPGLLRGLLAVRPDVAPSAGAPASSEPLTAVEHQVLRLVADGLTNREIGERMRWSVATAKKYVQRTLEKLAVSNRTQAVVNAIRRGLLD